MNLYSDDIYRLNAPPAVEINVRPNLLYTEEYSYLTKDELEVLFLLATTEMSAEGLTSFSFSGIKRRLGKHQQKITKAVNRLVEKELISKKNSGYSISSKGTSILSEVIKLQNAVDLHQTSDRFLQKRIAFNRELSLDELALMLIGKWFGSFRYISHTEGKQLTVRWQLVDNKSSATLRIYRDEAIIDIIPDTKDKQLFAYEQALEELTQYLVDLIASMGVRVTVVSEGWTKSPADEIDFQEKLSSWLNMQSNIIPEN
ncbi:MAG: hypothetical protein ACTSXA_14035 [Candidatus Heimdallarchaeota archaeon]